MNLYTFSQSTVVLNHQNIEIFFMFQKVAATLPCSVHLIKQPRQMLNMALLVLLLSISTHFVGISITKYLVLGVLLLFFSLSLRLIFISFAFISTKNCHFSQLWFLVFWFLFFPYRFKSDFLFFYHFIILSFTSSIQTDWISCSFFRWFFLFASHIYIFLCLTHFRSRYTTWGWITNIPILYTRIYDGVIW